MDFGSIYLTYPFLIINKYVFCKLTNRPFIWLSTYTADLLTLACFIYVFGWNVKFSNVKNSGYGLEQTPTFKMMHVEAFGTHMSTFEINIQFYVGFWLLISFIR